MQPAKRNQLKLNHLKVHSWPYDQIATLSHSSSDLLPSLKQP